jgi:hypothetical protein
MSDDAAYIVRFKEITKGGLRREDLRAFEEQAYGGSDRGRAIMLSTITENALYAYLKTKLRGELTAGDRKRLFGFDGLLGSFGGRTSIAYAFGFITPALKHELDHIRVIRNGFAHSTTPITFETPQTAEVCANLHFPERGDAFIPNGYLSAVPDEELEQASDKTHPRTRFIMACHLAAEDLLVAEQGGFGGRSP